MTTGMPAPLEQRLETLGGYRPLGESRRSPPSHSHLVIDVGGHRWHVLSAIHAATPDPSGRANKLAHHLALSGSELVDAGPAWLLRQSGLMLDRFDGPPRWIPQPRMLPDSGLVDPRRADAWQRAAGDAGWAGALANQFLLDPSRVSCIVHDPDLDALALIDEAISLLPPGERWRVTFATHFQQSVAGVHCAWRFCLTGTPAAADASRRATGLYLDINEVHRTGRLAKGGRYTELARDGHAPWWTRDDDRAGVVDATSVDARRSQLGDDVPVDDTTIDLASEDDDARSRSRTSSSSSAGAQDGRSSFASTAAPQRALRVGGLLLLIMGVAVLAALTTLLIDQRWGSRSSRTSAPDDRARELEVDRDRQRDDLLEMRRTVEDLERRLVDSSSRERSAIAERDEQARRADAAEARARAAESMIASSAGQVPSTSAPRSPSPGRTESPFERPSEGAPAVPLPGTLPSLPSGTSTPPPAPMAASTGALTIVPAERFAREVSRLGAISSDRRVLALMPQAIRSIAVEIPAGVRSVAARPGGDPRSITLSAAGSGTGVRRPVAVVEARGQEVVFAWDASTSPSTHASHLASVDAAIPLLTIAVTLDDGSVRRLASEPSTRTIAIGRSTTPVTVIEARGLDLSLSVDPTEGWSVDSARSTGTAAVVEHASGSVLLALDADHGTVVARFQSPLRDELDAAESDLRKLERDRPSVPPEERAFHESAVRDARARVDQLRARVTRESPALPSTWPTARIKESTIGRELVILRLVPSTPAASGGSP